MLALSMSVGSGGVCATCGTARKTHYLLNQTFGGEICAGDLFVCFEGCGSQHEPTEGIVHLKELQKFVVPLCLK